MSRITTHILDTSSGKPAVGVNVILNQFSSGSWVLLANGVTDNDGRVKTPRSTRPAGFEKPCLLIFRQRVARVVALGPLLHIRLELTPQTMFSQD